MLNIGVIGYGYWGPNLVRNFHGADGACVSMVADSRPARRELALKNLPSAIVVEDAIELINSPDVDAVAIATPVASHFELSMAALKVGKHVFVEKPMTASTVEANELIAEAEARGLTLMVDHTFIYTGAVRKLKELVDSGELGELYYYDSARINLGLFQHDVNVLWDLAVHDLSILDYLIDKKPIAVSCTGMAHVPGQPENIAYMSLFFEDNLIAHINVNWLAPLKLRRTLLGGSKKMLLFNDLEPSEKIRIYDKGVDIVAGDDSAYDIMSLNYRSGDMLAPKINNTEALSIEADHFVD